MKKPRKARKSSAKYVNRKWYPSITEALKDIPSCEGYALFAVTCIDITRYVWAPHTSKGNSVTRFFAFPTTSKVLPFSTIMKFLNKTTIPSSEVPSRTGDDATGEGLVGVDVQPATDGGADPLPALTANHQCGSHD